MHPVTFEQIDRSSLFSTFGSFEQDLKNLAKGFSNIKIVNMDLDDFDSIQTSAEEIQKLLKNDGLNLLINNAAINIDGGLNDITPEMMTKTHTINVIGPMMVTKAFLPALMKAAQLSDEPGFSSKKAAVINMSSIMGSMETFSVHFYWKAFAYRISKAGLNMVTKCLTNELTPHGILCASVHPGWVKTDMGTEKAKLTKEESIQGLLRVFSNLSDKDNGSFIDWRGERVPW
ncbi:C-signal-like isoform X1 [Hemitrygon akajei]|uniref:C-signal-like isoform X1 n=1 Tax=Hemitrygon akajei TaxID=2704970 RepID=UPI003BF995EB